MEGKTKTRGFSELKQSLAKLATEVKGEIAQKSLIAGGNVILASARQKIPKRTGATAGQLNQRVTQEGIVEAGVIGDRAHIAKFLEFGTKQKEEGGVRMRPRPFLRPATEESRDAFMGAVAKTMEEGITVFTSRQS